MGTIDAKKRQALALLPRLVDVPASYLLKNAKLVNYDNDMLWWLRFEKNGDVVTTSNEHFSAIVDLKEKLLRGMMYLDASLSNAALPNKQQAEQIAAIFLYKIAPDLIQRLQTLWVKPHSEIISLIQEGHKKEVVISGMKVKYINKTSKKFAWVIIGKDKQVITFERDVIWNTDLNCRVTQKWLHSH